MTNAETPRPRRIGRKLLAAGLAFLLADQAVNQFVIGTGAEGGWLLGRRIAPFDPPVFMPSQATTLARLADGSALAGPQFGDVDFDAELGWAPPPAGSSPEVTWCGARAGGPEVPRQRQHGVRRIATYGCSFTFGSEVGGADAWPAQLDALREDLEVVNFGVPGYGVDQALLRFERIAARAPTDQPQADEIWLGFLPGTLLRLVSVYRPALRHYTTTVAVKPRFRFGADGTTLELVPNPASSVSDLAALIDDSKRFESVTETDGFMARAAAAYAPRGTHPLHWLASTRVLLTMLERGGRDWAARATDQDDECHRLVIELTSRFRNHVESHGKAFSLVLLPDRESLVPGPKPWDAIVESLRNRGIEVLDVTTAMVKAGAHADASMWAPNGHYSKRGNAIIAGALDKRQRE